jgi:hypothetical protein
LRLVDFPSRSLYSPYLIAITEILSPVVTHYGFVLRPAYGL